MNIIKRIFKSTIMTYILFIFGNVIFVFFISLIAWACFNTNELFCAGIGLVVDGSECPDWSFPVNVGSSVSFIEVFIMCGVIYLAFICLILIGLLLISREEAKELEYLRKQKKR